MCRHNGRHVTIFMNQEIMAKRLNKPRGPRETDHVVKRDWPCGQERLTVWSRDWPCGQERLTVWSRETDRVVWESSHVGEMVDDVREEAGMTVSATAV